MIHDLLAIGAGLVIGVASGILGVGGGIFMVPILSLGFGLTQHAAQGTSLAAIVPTSVVGAATHDRKGSLDRRAAAWIGLGTAFGAAAGAVVAIHSPREFLARAFGILLLVSAYRMWPRRRPPAAVAPEVPVDAA